MNIIEWLNINQGMVMSVLTLVYVLATILILKANNRSVSEMKRTRKEENRPYIVVFFDRKPGGPVNLIVKNIGKTIAKNTRINIEPELSHPQSHPLSKTDLLNKPIPDIPPNFEYKAFVGMGWNLKRDDESFPVYEATVTYRSKSNDEYEEHYILDLNFESGLLSLDERDINDLAKDFDNFSKRSEKQLKSISNSLKEISKNKNV